MVTVIHSAFHKKKDGFWMSTTFHLKCLHEPGRRKSLSISQVRNNTIYFTQLFVVGSTGLISRTSAGSKPLFVGVYSHLIWPHSAGSWSHSLALLIRFGQKIAACFEVISTLMFPSQPNIVWKEKKLARRSYFYTKKLQGREQHLMLVVQQGLDSHHLLLLVIGYFYYLLTVGSFL